MLHRECSLSVDKLTSLQFYDPVATYTFPFHEGSTGIHMEYYYGVRRHSLHSTSGRIIIILLP